MPGNEAVDFLAKGGGGGGGGGHKKEQLDRSASYAEVKTILKAKQYSKRRLEHPRYNKTNPTTFLTRREQVTVFVLRTGHKRLNQSKPLIGHTEQCPCGTGSETSEHLLRSCPLYEPLRKGIWPDHTPVARNSSVACGTYNVLPPFMEETEFPSDEREEEEEEDPSHCSMWSFLRCQQMLSVTAMIECTSDT